MSPGAGRKNRLEPVVIVAIVVLVIVLAWMLGLGRLIKGVVDPYDRLHRLHGQVQMPFQTLSVREAGSQLGFFGDNLRLDVRYESDLAPEETCGALVAALEEATARPFVVRPYPAESAAACGISTTVEDEHDSGRFNFGVVRPTKWEPKTIVTLSIF